MYRTRSNGAQPFVHYHCGCADLYKRTPITLQARDSPYTPSRGSARYERAEPPKLSAQAHIETETPSDPLEFTFEEHNADLITLPVSKLYYCEQCESVKCTRCLQEEIVSYYCPNCLFEVPTASVKYEKNRCARNCFECPICENTLSVVANESGAATSPDTTPSQNNYYLSCGVCRWDSREIQLTFEKPTGLAGNYSQHSTTLTVMHNQPLVVMQKSEDENPDVQEFENLKEYFEKTIRINQPTYASLPSSLLSIPGVPGYNKSHMSQLSQPVIQAEPYESEVKLPIEKSQVEELLNLTEANSSNAHFVLCFHHIGILNRHIVVSTLKQRLKQLNSQPYDVCKLRPQRIHLRTKRSKRCKTCRQILIKPDQKANSTRFKIRFTAIHYIPIITLSKQPALHVNIATQIHLKFTNPLYTKIDITLATAVNTHDNEAQISVLAPQFSVDAYRDVWEIEEDENKRGSKILKTPTSSETTNLVGVEESKANTVTVSLEVIPKVETPELTFPLLVTYSYVKRAPEGEAPEEEGLKKHTFWTMIGLGPVD
ncbi:dynactin p62 [Basidiobolus meristosporus CBS 931.73]|uniref:Dynactin subunit 4 n=1 Tax=Basidiobolus meristosporus CBS 931.73 TaxID=1314790 RepID=A0A1Y1XW03_9FUNG|nr:dynactin p62 [Basidiobolus meristosporus CBS 931.73]|eukprot:ORX89930.1 dynactin p62 [Basidiobolus meristosporus CBS 931.73]